VHDLSRRGEYPAVTRVSVAMIWSASCSSLRSSRQMCGGTVFGLRRQPADHWTRPSGDNFPRPARGQPEQQVQRRRASRRRPLRPRRRPYVSAVNKPAGSSPVMAIARPSSMNASCEANREIRPDHPPCRAGLSHMEFHTRDAATECPCERRDPYGAGSRSQWSEAFFHF